MDSETPLTIVQILAPGHSGTTILDRALATGPAAIGLGEVDNTIPRLSAPARTKRCSCGSHVEDCAFWGRVAREAADDEAVAAAIVAVARHDGYAFVIDSSKRRTALKGYLRLRDQGRVAIRPVRILRDPRAWVHSQLRLGKDKSDLGLVKLFYQWVVKNLLCDYRALHLGAAPFVVIHDRFAQAEDGLEALLLAFFGGASQHGGLQESNQHCVAGNQLVFSDRRNRISYDTAFLQDRRLDDALADLAPVRKYFAAMRELHLRHVDAFPSAKRSGATEHLKRCMQAETLAELEPVADFVEGALSGL